MKLLTEQFFSIEIWLNRRLRPRSNISLRYKWICAQVVVSILEGRALGVHTDPLGGGQEVLGLQVLGGELCEIGGLGFGALWTY